MKGKLMQMNKMVLALGLAMAMTSCNSGAAGGSKSDGQDTLRTEVLSLDSIWYSDSANEYYKDFPIGVQLSLEMPSFDQNPVLANAIMEWVMEQLNVTEQVDLKDGKAILKQCLADMEEEESIEYSVKKVYESDLFVSFEMVGYEMFLGAAHGTPMRLGATFRKSDGKQFGWNMFKRETAADQLQPILKAGLKKAFDVESDEELEENLAVMEPYSADYLPKPETEPWVTKEGVHLQYQSYEIACYAAGIPEVIIPLKDAAPLMTGLGKTVLEDK